MDTILYLPNEFGQWPYIYNTTGLQQNFHLTFPPIKNYRTKQMNIRLCLFYVIS
jgi:hypothetical protein